MRNTLTTLRLIMCVVHEDAADVAGKTVNIFCWYSYACAKHL